MKIALVGSPNVGKSVIFHHLTGQYVTVSNYPGTTVEVTWGQFKRDGRAADVVDTPGIYSLHPISGEEQVTRELLFMEKPDLVIHVIDAKNIGRMLSLTLQLAECGFLVVIALNMMDEARQRGLKIDGQALAKKLGIPVIPMVSVTGEGVEELKNTVSAIIAGGASGKTTHATNKVEKNVRQTQRCSDRVEHNAAQSKANHRTERIGDTIYRYSDPIEQKISAIQRIMKNTYPVTLRSLALFLLEGDDEIREWVEKGERAGIGEKLAQIVGTNREQFQATTAEITVARQSRSDELLRNVFDQDGVKAPPLQIFLSNLCTRPLTGIPILCLVLYFGIYKFVGGLGAGVVVDFIDKVIFQKYLNPAFTGFFTSFLPYETLRSLFIGEYGILTLGLRYALAIILPVVGMFFFAFSILEDSGYFPRLALLIDRVFKIIGLNGRAVIPMVLGLGCDTMATLTTRILETRRERIIATFLLALAIPCSAQLGVIAALLTGHRILVWLLVILGVLLIIGWLAGRLVPGEKTGFYMEVPSLRWPKLGNILAKTRARMGWYLLEILPVFIYSSVIIWILQVSGLFQKLLDALKPVMTLLSLPEEAAVTFLFGFFRRDYGAAGLFDLHQQGLISGDGLVVACITLTLFVPCFAQFIVMLNEQGVKVGLAIFGFIVPFAFFMGYVVSRILMLL